VDGPYNMSVLTDNLGKCSGCNTTVERDVTYQVMNLSGSSTSTIAVGESLTASGWNCNQSNPGFQATSCSQNKTTNSAGQFTDAWTLEADGYSPVGCGLNVDDHWLWCPNSSSIGHLSGYCHTNAVSINGVVNPPNQFKTGTIINP